MAYRRHKVQVHWHQELKNDCAMKLEGFYSRQFRNSDVYVDFFAWWDYPLRTCSRSWKDQSKKRKQWEQ